MSLNLAELIATSTPPAALVALAREIAAFLPDLSHRPPTAAEAEVLNAARIYAHAAGHLGGIEGLLRLLQAVQAVDHHGSQAAALLDRLWTGVPVQGEAPRPCADPTALIDAAMERGLRLAEPPSAWSRRVY